MFRVMKLVIMLTNTAKINFPRTTFRSRIQASTLNFRPTVRLKARLEEAGIFRKPGVKNEGRCKVIRYW